MGAGAAGRHFGARWRLRSCRVTDARRTTTIPEAEPAEEFAAEAEVRGWERDKNLSAKKTRCQETSVCCDQSDQIFTPNVTPFLL